MYVVIRFYNNDNDDNDDNKMLSQGRSARLYTRNVEHLSFDDSTSSLSSPTATFTNNKDKHYSTKPVLKYDIMILAGASMTILSKK